jgi:hypothetical protein
MRTEFLDDHGCHELFAQTLARLGKISPGVQRGGMRAEWCVSPHTIRSMHRHLAGPRGKVGLRVNNAEKRT